MVTLCCDKGQVSLQTRSGPTANQRSLRNPGLGAKSGLGVEAPRDAYPCDDNHGEHWLRVPRPPRALAQRADMRSALQQLESHEEASAEQTASSLLAVRRLLRGIRLRLALGQRQGLPGNLLLH